MADDLTRWLREVGLGAHAAAFGDQGIDLHVLGDLSETDLKELGLSIGDRKRLVRAVAARTGASAPAAAVGEPPVIEADRRQLTVMFIDLIDSSPLAQRFDPEEMRQVLRVFHQACASAIEAHEGHIAQYSGDGLLVYFGYPQAHEDDAVRGVLAGLAVVTNLAAANVRLEALYDVRLKVRIGVETGLVVAGEVGAGAALDRQAIVGETPIVAARLQALAPTDSVIVGPGTERLIQGSFRLQNLGRHALKGVAGPIDIWRVDGRTEAEGSFEIRAGRGLTPLVGRTAELDMLRQRWRQSSDGEMRCVLLVGEPGIGKSRTLRAFRDGLAGDEHDALSFHCSPYYRDSPFWPVLQRLQRSFGLDPKAFTDSAGDRLEAELAAFGIDTGEAAQVLSNLLGMPSASRYAAIDMASPTFKQRCFDVLSAMVEDMTRRSPLLLVIEDAHWIDPSTLELVRILLARLTTARLLVVITARPEFQPDWTFPHLVQLNLDRLSRRDRLEMVDRLTGGKTLPTVVRDRIVARTDGVPLFVEELTKTVLQSGLLHDAGDRYELQGPLQTLAIPDTLQGSLLSRLDRLAPSVKEVAQIAATIGREFDRGLLGAIAGRAEVELALSLESLVAAEIILSAPGSALGGGAYLFRHALIQEIAYQSLLLARRRQFHGLIAGALEAHYPEVVERQPEVVAQNFAASETPIRAIDYWRQAAERALARAAYKEAIAHAQAGMGAAARLSVGAERELLSLPMLLVRAEAEFRLGDRGGVVKFHRAVQVARKHGLASQFVRAVLGFDDAQHYLDEFGDAALSLLEEALSDFCTEENVERCRLLSRLAVTLYWTGASDRASEVAQQAIVLARRLDDPQGLLDALLSQQMLIGASPLASTDFPDRRRLLEESRKTSEEMAHKNRIGHACARALAGYLEIGDYEGFSEALERCEQIASGHEFVHGWIASGGETMRAILVGDFARAEHKAAEALNLASSDAEKAASGIHGMQMFTIRREQGRLGEVAPLLRRFMDEHPEDETWRPGLMLIASDLGFDAPARRLLEKFAETDFAIPMDSKRLVTLTYFAEVAARVGDADIMARIYQQLLPFRDQAVTVPAFTLCCGAAGRYLGQLAGALGDWSAAGEHFEYALAMNERLNARPWLAHTQHDYAVMLSGRGRKRDHERAMTLSASAASTAQSLNMSALAGRISGAGSRSSH